MRGNGNPRGETCSNVRRITYSWTAEVPLMGADRFPYRVEMHISRGPGWSTLSRLIRYCGPALAEGIPDSTVALTTQLIHKRACDTHQDGSQG